MLKLDAQPKLLSEVISEILPRLRRKSEMNSPDISFSRPLRWLWRSWMTP